MVVTECIISAAIVDNRLLSVSQLDTYVRLKDLTTARAHFVAQLNCAVNNVISGLNQHQTTLITRLEQITKIDPEKRET